MTAWRETLAKFDRSNEFVRPYRGRVVLGVMAGGLYGATNASLLLVIKRVWAQILETPDRSWSWWQIIALAALLPLAMFARAACDYLSDYMMSWVGMRVVMDLRARLFDHLQSLSLDFYTASRAGDLISRVTNDVQLIQRAITNTTQDVVKQPITLVAVTGDLLYTDWKLTVAALVVFPVCLIPILIYGRKVRKASRDTRAAIVDAQRVARGHRRGARRQGVQRRATRD